ncbi:TetR/AcrR family transcriptional regulator [Kineosporia sp. NBRC 101731]|uniref:TetR/AcrR family transcriptional regulator n=1 Tax=Kineosporia sp. NBRC 101731 TaxID=3032199 RepID=UPI00249FAD33|nr:TetR/AcrR family transcriptional regulator [Kineosporia sp. NBRC 101731]GLY28845.1 TetR family transcriptional regulator [Kineosporia sp. NBRC 101731]
MPERAAPANRRERYAQMTREEVVSAARKLFATHGYEQTTVEKIAREAGVSTATVYAQCGGKEGLLRTLMDIWTTSPTVGRIIGDAVARPTGAEKLEVLADGYIEHFLEANDIMSVLYRAAASSKPVEEFMEVAEQRHREALEAITQSIADVGALADGLSVGDAAKIIYFHFRYQQVVLAVETFGWGVDRAKEWSLERVKAAILKD